jgi:hypothetical protein
MDIHDVVLWDHDGRPIFGDRHQADGRSQAPTLLPFDRQFRSRKVNSQSCS